MKRKNVKTLKIKGELLFVLNSKREWISRVPEILPEKERSGETWLWIDKNGNVFEKGADFEAAEDLGTYPCSVYRLVNVASAKTRR